MKSNRQARRLCRGRRFYLAHEIGNRRSKS
jgi:hypothetical protein